MRERAGMAAPVLRAQVQFCLEMMEVPRLGVALLVLAVVFQRATKPAGRYSYAREIESLFMGR